MDNIINVLLSFSFVMFCIMTAAFVFVVRKIVEQFWSKAKDTKWWRDLLLPIMPIIFGGLIGLVAKMYPYPGDIKSASGRIMFGVAAGMLGGNIYRAIKSMIKAKDTLPEDE